MYVTDVEGIKTVQNTSQTHENTCLVSLMNLSRQKSLPGHLTSFIGKYFHKVVNLQPSSLFLLNVRH